jgi:hypothetical protein
MQLGTVHKAGTGSDLFRLFEREGERKRERTRINFLEGGHLVVMVVVVKGFLGACKETAQHAPWPWVEEMG